jgi:hypothetical protein
MYEGVLHCCRRRDVRCTCIRNRTGRGPVHQDLVHVSDRNPRRDRYLAACPRTPDDTTKCLECGYGIPPIDSYGQAQIWWVSEMRKGLSAEQKGE